MRAVRGFTLLELIIVMIISMILLFIGIPGFQTIIQNNRLNAASNSIVHNLLFARSQSVSLINYVTVCPLVSNRCTNNWINGMDIFIDSNQDNVYGSEEVLLKTGERFRSNDELVFPTSSITFTPDGQIMGSSATFRYCSGDRRIGVNVAYSGRAKVIDGSEFTDCN